MSRVEPKTDRRLVAAIRLSGILAMVLLAVGALMAAFHAPLLPDCDDDDPPVNCQTSPTGHKIFYFHVPVAFAAYAAFIVLAVASFQVLSTKEDHWDAMAVAAAETGVLFAALVLFSGSMWGHLEWGMRYWNPWDLKLTLTLVMFLVYTAYLILRKQLPDPRRRARIAAVYALLGFATVPLSYMAQRVWRSVHPVIFDPTDTTTGLITPGIRETFYVNVLAFVSLLAFLLLVRYRIEIYRRIGAEDDTQDEGREGLEGTS